MWTFDIPDISSQSIHTIKGKTMTTTVRTALSEFIALDDFTLMQLANDPRSELLTSLNWTIGKIIELGMHVAESKQVVTFSINNVSGLAVIKFPEVLQPVIMASGDKLGIIVGENTPYLALRMQSEGLTSSSIYTRLSVPGFLEQFYAAGNFTVYERLREHLASLDELLRKL